MITRRALLASALLSYAFTSSHANPLSGNTGIILIGASWCHICKRAAPMLARYAQERGIPVLVASADLRPLPPFPSFVDPVGHPLASGVSRFPTTLVFANTTQQIAGSFEGYRSAEQYLTRLDHLVRYAEGQS